MKRLLNGLFMAAGAAVLAVGVLVAVETLLSKRPKYNLPVAAPPPIEPLALPVEEKAPRNFSIKRTKSEVGFVYWILQGYGRYKCFILCDTWDEAMEQAKARMSQVDGTPASQPSLVSVLA
jgi:hypothetical protein